MNDRKLSRRDVLKVGCAATVGFAAPVVIPSTVLGNAETAPPSERVTLGHIGVGRRGNFLMHHSRGARGVQNLAAADCYKHHRERGAAFTQGEAYKDFRKLLDRKDIDAVIVATPDHWHVPIALMAARAGKDAYVEKPLGVTLEQDIVCQKVFTQQKRIFQYGTQQREAKHQEFGRDLVLSGKLGKLKAIEVQCPNGRSGGSTVEAAVPEGFDYEMWLGPAPKVPYTPDRCRPKGTYMIYDQSIGYLGGWGAHPLDILVLCYTGDQSGPYTVEGTGVVPTEGLYDTVYDWDMTMQMADGVKITFKPNRADSTKFIGTEGRLELSRKSIRTFPENLVSGNLAWVSHAHSATRHIQSFVDSVRSREEASSPIKDSVRSDVMSHLCDIAVRTGEKITWDPTKQEITGGSAKARAMASRPMRGPWTL